MKTRMSLWIACAFAKANVAAAETLAPILCSSADAALDTLPNKVMVRERQIALLAVKNLETKLAATRKRLERTGKRIPQSP